MKRDFGYAAKYYILLCHDTFILYFISKSAPPPSSPPSEQKTRVVYNIQRSKKNTLITLPDRQYSYNKSLRKNYLQARKNQFVLD